MSHLLRLPMVGGRNHNRKKGDNTMANKWIEENEATFRADEPGVMDRIYSYFDAHTGDADEEQGGWVHAPYVKIRLAGDQFEAKSYIRGHGCWGASRTGTLIGARDHIGEEAGGSYFCAELDGEEICFLRK